MSSQVKSATACLSSRHKRRRLQASRVLKNGNITTPTIDTMVGSPPGPPARRILRCAAPSVRTAGPGSLMRVNKKRTAARASGDRFLDCQCSGVKDPRTRTFSHEQPSGYFECEHKAALCNKALCVLRIVSWCEARGVPCAPRFAGAAFLQHSQPLSSPPRVRSPPPTLPRLRRLWR